jgi:hypothetical protein
MKKANLILMAAMAAAGVMSVTGALLAPSAAVAAEGQKLGAKVAKPLRAAQEAMTEQKWAEAIAHIDEAAAVQPQTPYESFMVDELGWFARIQTKDYAGAEPALERAITSGFVPEADLPQRYKAMTQLNYQLKNYPKTVEYGKKYVAAVPGSADVGAMVAHAQYLQNDFAGAQATVQQLTAGSSKPDEQLLMIGLRSSYELQDRAATMRSLESLVRYYPQQKYWEDLLTNQLYETKTERDLRVLYRLMADTNTLDKPEEYSEIAVTLMAGGFPSEAAGVLERGLSAGVFQAETKTRAESELKRAGSAADADRKELATADKALAAANTGNEMVAMGKLFFSVGEYAKAADAIQKGLAKGGVTDTDDANALLGIAHARSSRYPEALAAFGAIRDAKLNEVARLWKLYVETKQAPAAPVPAAG